MGFRFGGVRGPWFFRRTFFEGLGIGKEGILSIDLGLSLDSLTPCSELFLLFPGELLDLLVNGMTASQYRRFQRFLNLRRIVRCTTPFEGVRRWYYYLENFRIIQAVLEIHLNVSDVGWVI